MHFFRIVPLKNVSSVCVFIFPVILRKQDIKLEIVENVKEFVTMWPTICAIAAVLLLTGSV